MNVVCVLLAVAVCGPIDWDARWASYQAAGWAEDRSAPDCDVYLTPVGCAPQTWAPWLKPGEVVQAGFSGPYIVGQTPIKPIVQTRGILTAYYVTHGPTYKKWIRVRFTMPDGRSGVFLWSPAGPVRCAVLYPEPRP